MSNHSKSAEARHPSRTKKRHSASVESPDKRLAETLRRAAERKEAIKRSTFGLYSLKTNESYFGFPFTSPNDKLALVAAKQMLPLANLYRIGSFCLLDGKVKSLPRPVVVLDNKVN